MESIGNRTRSPGISTVRKSSRPRRPPDMNKPMYMIADLAVGGYWPGNPDATTPFPAQMEIDYLRAYQNAPASSGGAGGDPPPGGNNTGGTGGDPPPSGNSTERDEPQSTPRAATIRAPPRQPSPAPGPTISCGGNSADGTLADLDDEQRASDLRPGGSPFKARSRHRTPVGALRASVISTGTARRTSCGATPTAISWTGAWTARKSLLPKGSRLQGGPWYAGRLLERRRHRRFQRRRPSDILWRDTERHAHGLDDERLRRSRPLRM